VVRERVRDYLCAVLPPAPVPLRRLGPEGPAVFPVGLGAMPLSLEGRPSSEQARAVLHAALDAGVTHIDTADVYCLDDADLGHNERLIGAVLRERGARDVVVATKGGLRRPGGDWVEDGRPAHLRAACEASLRALGVGCIDLYYLHAPDPAVPFAESVGALAELRAAGLIARVGLSNVTADQIAEAAAIVPISAVQNVCSPLVPDALHDGVLAACEARGVAFVAYSPVGGADRAELAVHPALVDRTVRYGATPEQLALAWLLSASPSLIAIPGASRVASVLSSVGAASLTLDVTDRAALDTAFLPAP
jgi:aryl-alcohol dehydrogenase-like predicted oxidoreductase